MPNVEVLAGDLGLEGEQVGLSAVLDVDEVEPLGTVAVELRPLAGEQAFGDGWHDTGALAGPVDVHVAEDRVAVSVGTG
jgi:hypothetical protein